MNKLECILPHGSGINFDYEIEQKRQENLHSQRLGLYGWKRAL